MSAPRFLSIHLVGRAANALILGLDREMKAFLDWFNADSVSTDIDDVLKAGLFDP